MTQLEVLFRYATPPSENVVMALGKAREVYGMRRLVFDREAMTVRVEYDATRLTTPAVRQLLLGAGLTVVEEISLIPPQPEPKAAEAEVLKA